MQGLGTSGLGPARLEQRMFLDLAGLVHLQGLGLGKETTSSLFSICFKNKGGCHQ